MNFFFLFGFLLVTGDCGLSFHSWRYIEHNKKKKGHFLSFRSHHPSGFFLPLFLIRYSGTEEVSGPTQLCYSSKSQRLVSSLLHHHKYTAPITTSMQKSSLRICVTESQTLHTTHTQISVIKKNGWLFKKCLCFSFGPVLSLWLLCS